MPLHIVIVGGGFAGMYAAKRLVRSSIRITLVDKRNFHLFQPLLYQVATGGLSPGDIASPLRAIFHQHPNIDVIMDEMIDFDPLKKMIKLQKETLSYDILIFATGASHHYFGNDAWAKFAPGLKTIEDAINIRHRIFQAFEYAEREKNIIKRKEWLTFVIIGGGPTGVEMAGAIAELTNTTLKHDFHNFNPAEAYLYLIEAGDRILPSFKLELSLKAKQVLKKLGVTVLEETRVINISENQISYTKNNITSNIFCGTIIWSAGVKASSLGQVIAERCKISLDRMGKVPVLPYLTIPEFPDIYVIGDLANFSHQDGQPLPGVATVAMQQGRYIADKLIKLSRGHEIDKPFQYKNKGSLAVIGRNAAIADFGFIRLSGWLAWLIWAIVHIRFLIEFDNKVLVLLQWAWNYFTRKRGARLITGEELPI